MRGGDEQRRPVRAAEHAGEAAAVERDCLQYFAAFAHAHAALVGDVGVPDRAFRVEADAVGDAVAERRPRRAGSTGCRRRAMSKAVSLPGVGFGDDQRRIVRRHRHAVGEGDAVGDLRTAPSGVTSAIMPGAKASPAIMSKPAPLTIGVAAAVDDDLVPGAIGEAVEISMGRQ